MHVIEGSNQDRQEPNSLWNWTSTLFPPASILSCQLASGLLRNIDQHRCTRATTKEHRQNDTPMSFQKHVESFPRPISGFRASKAPAKFGSKHHVAKTNAIKTRTSHQPLVFTKHHQIPTEVISQWSYPKQWVKYVWSPYAGYPQSEKHPNPPPLQHSIHQNLGIPAHPWEQATNHPPSHSPSSPSPSRGVFFRPPCPGEALLSRPDWPLERKPPMRSPKLGALGAGSSGGPDDGQWRCMAGLLRSIGNQWLMGKHNTTTADVSSFSQESVPVSHMVGTPNSSTMFITDAG